jgi:hypothetical protein
VWKPEGEKDLLEDPSVDGGGRRNIKKKKWDGGGLDWIELAQDRDRWWALVNAVMREFLD